MKVFVLEFSFMSDLFCNMVEVKATALSKEQLKDAVMKELHGISKSLKVTSEEKWNEVKHWITEETFSFPIMEVKEL